MPDPALTPRSALAGTLVAGRHGRPDGAPGVVISERSQLSLASLIARKGKADTLGQLLKSAYGLDLPGPGRLVGTALPDGRSISLASAGPGQWLVIGEEAPELADELAHALGSCAMVTEQSDGRCVLRLCGPKAADVLAKGLSLDLHPRAFAPGQTAVAQAAHIAVQIWQLDAKPTYEIALFRSLAGSFWSWLSASAAEYGYEVAAG